MIPRTWTVGYLGTDGAIDIASGLTGDAYEVQHLAPERIGQASLDALVVETAVLADADEELLAAIDAAVPSLVVAVGTGTDVPASALGIVDDHLALDGSLAPLRALLDEARTQRWRNLGLSAEALLEQVFSVAPIHLYLKDEAARHTRASHPYEKSFDLIGQTDVEAYPNDRLATRAYADDRHVIETGDPILEKEAYDETDGTWTLCSKVPIRDDGDIVGLLGATRHVTERKAAQRDLERQVDRLEEFASILSHDLRNPLSITLGRAELAHERHPDDEHIESILRTVKRMASIIDDVLTMTKKGQQIDGTQSVSLRDVAEESWETASTGEASITVAADLQFEAARGRLKHVFENLYENSVKHGGEAVTVRVGPLPDESGFYIADDGSGVPDEDRDRIFEQGFSTAPDSTGLGLNIVQQVVEAHGWTITVAASDAKGARFEIEGIDSTSPVVDGSGKC